MRRRRTQRSPRITKKIHQRPLPPWIIKKAAAGRSSMPLTSAVLTWPQFELQMGLLSGTMGLSDSAAGAAAIPAQLVSQLTPKF